jgi:hypothetical protein
MRLLVIGDSHCRDMTPALQFLAPLDQYYTITKGDQTDEIICLYRKQIPAIWNFNPTKILLHAGHNDVAWHRTRNPLPIVSRDAARITLDLQLNSHLIILLLKYSSPTSFREHSHTDHPCLCQLLANIMNFQKDISIACANLLLIEDLLFFQTCHFGHQYQV